MKGHNMTDFTKYKNITVDNNTYNDVTKLQGVIVPEMKIQETQNLLASNSESMK